MSEDEIPERIKTAMYVNQTSPDPMTPGEADAVASLARAIKAVAKANSQLAEAIVAVTRIQLRGSAPMASFNNVSASVDAPRRDERP
jgi:hypothetical protein